MHSRTVALVVVLLIVGAFLRIAPQAVADVGRPGWSVGDYWIYTTFGLQSFNLPDGTTLNYSVAGMATIEYRGTTFSTYHLTISLVSLPNVTYGGSSLKRLSGDAWYNQSDLSLLRFTLRTWTFDSSLGSAGTWLNESHSWTADPPLAPRFPLRTGMGWSGNATVNLVSVGIDDGRLYGELNQTGGGRFSVGSNAIVNVPAGTFSATPMTENLSFNGQWTFIGANPLLPFTFAEVTVAYYSPVVGNAVCVEDVGYGAGCGGVGAQDGFELIAYGHATNPAPAAFLGLSLLEWAVLAVAIAAGSVLAITLVRRRRRTGERGPRAQSGTSPAIGEPPRPKR